jgi:hypothetical protein
MMLKARESRHTEIEVGEALEEVHAAILKGLDR